MSHFTTYGQSVEQLLDKATFIVEASSFEQLMLWQQHARGSIFSVVDKNHNLAFEQLSWEQSGGGSLVTVGYHCRQPVCISLSWCRIDGQIIMFWEPTSRVVNHEMIEKWLKEHFTRKYDQGTRWASCDANNFGHCLSAIKEANRTS